MDALLFCWLGQPLPECWLAVIGTKLIIYNEHSNGGLSLAVCSLSGFVPRPCSDCGEAQLCGAVYNLAYELQEIALSLSCNSWMTTHRLSSWRSPPYVWNCVCSDISF